MTYGRCQVFEACCHLLKHICDRRAAYCTTCGILHWSAHRLNVLYGGIPVLTTFCAANCTKSMYRGTQLLMSCRYSRQHLVRNGYMSKIFVRSRMTSQFSTLYRTRPAFWTRLKSFRRWRLRPTIPNAHCAVRCYRLTNATQWR